MSSALIIYSTGYPHRFLGALLKVFYLFQNKKKKTPVRFQIHHTTSSPHGDLSRGDLQAGIKYPFEAEYVLKYIRRLVSIPSWSSALYTNLIINKEYDDLLIHSTVLRKIFKHRSSIKIQSGPDRTGWSVPSSIMYILCTTTYILDSNQLNSGEIEYRIK